MNNYRVENVPTYQPSSLEALQSYRTVVLEENPNNATATHVAPIRNVGPRLLSTRSLWGRTIDFISSIPRQIERAGNGISPPRFDGAPPPFGCGARTGLEDYENFSGDGGVRMDAAADSTQFLDVSEVEVICDPYTRFTRLLEPRNSDEVLMLAGLGGTMGEFICYSRYNERTQRSRSYVFNRFTRAEYLLEEGVNPLTNCSLSDNGRFIVFSSRVTNTEEQVILLDMLNPLSPVRAVLSESRLLSRPTPVSFPKITPDGTVVVFSSDSSTITSDDNTNGGIFLYHTSNSSFSRLALPSRFMFGGGFTSISLSNDGNRIAFITTELIPGTPATFASEAYLFDRRGNGSLTPLSQGLPLVSQFSDTGSIFISGDGRKVFFNRATLMSNGAVFNVYLWEVGSSARLLANMNQRPYLVGINREGTRIFIDTDVMASGWHRLAVLEVMDLNTNRRAVISQHFCSGDLPFRNTGAQMSANGEYGVVTFINFRLNGVSMPVLGFGLNTFLNP